MKQGSQTTLHCALNSHEKLQNGKYYSDCKPAKSKAIGDNSEKIMGIK